MTDEIIQRLRSLPPEPGAERIAVEVASRVRAAVARPPRRRFPFEAAAAAALFAVGVVTAAFVLPNLRPAPSVQARSSGQDDVDTLIEKLGAADFEEREKADEALRKRVADVAARLRRAASGSPDAEIRDRASKILEDHYAPLRALPKDSIAQIEAIERRAKELRAAGDASDADRLEARLDQVRESILSSRSGGGPPLDAGVHLVGVYEPADAANPDVKVFVPATSGPIILVLAAYEPVRWNVEASPGARIERILIGGYAVPTKGGMPAGVPITVRSYEGGDTEAFYSFDEKDDEFAETQNVVRELTGKEITTTTGQYTGPRGAVLSAGGGEAKVDRWQRLDLLDELHHSLAGPAQETIIPDAEELAAWEIRDGKTIAADAAIEWTAEKQGSLIGRKGVPRDWSNVGAIQFKFHSDSDQPVSLEIQAQVRFPSRFWRKVTVEGKGWHTVTVPLYQFRRTSAPAWSEIAWLVFNTRQPGTYRIDEIKLLPAKEGQSPLIEPDAELLKRAFPAADKPGFYKNERYRIAAEFEIDGAKLLKRLDDLWERFRAKLRVDAPFGPPATLVIFRDAKPYQEFCATTARDLFAASLGAVAADGYTFYEYSSSSWSDTWKEDRPVYVHEVCHQLISRHLRLEDDQKWAQEGLAAYFQIQMVPDNERADAAGWVRRLPDSETRIALASLDAKFAPKTSQYVQCLALIDYLLSTQEWPQVLAALQQSKSLKEIVETVLQADLGSFEKGWLGFCRNYK